MNRTDDYTIEISTLAGQLPSKISILEREIQSIFKLMAQLKKKGIIYATPHWRKEKGVPTYLYLIYPSKQGEKRRRDYIGKDDKRIQEALDAVDRANTYDSLTDDLNRLKGLIYNISQCLYDADRYLNDI